MKLKNKFLVLITSLIVTATITGTSYAASQTAVEHSVDQFIEEMTDRHQFDETYLRELFSQIHIDVAVTDKMRKPYEAQPWTVYRKFFITPERVEDGVKYWHDHRRELALAEKIYGVPASIIVAIIGVESRYGTKKGDFPTLQTLATLAFTYPARAPFFTKELEHFLLMTREQQFNPLAIRGSYAGAMGLPQFMPSSYRNYAMNFQGGKRVDLINNDADAISSVGNYLKRNGWQENQLVAVRARVKNADINTLKQDPLKPSDTLATLRQKGVAWYEKLPLDDKAAFFTVDYEQDSQYWIALPNFKVISSYNHNMQYVLAVFEFSEAIKERREHRL